MPISLSAINKFLHSHSPLSNTQTQRHAPKEGARELGEVRLSASPVNRGGEAVTSLSSSISAATERLMLLQPIELRASKENLGKQIEQVFSSARGTVNKLQERCGLSCLNTVMDRLSSEKDELKKRFTGEKVAEKSDIKDCKNFSKHLTKAILESIKESVGSKQFKQFNYESIVKNELRIDFASQLGKTEKLWKPISNNIIFQSGTYESKMTPASRLAGLQENYKKDGVFGVSSMSTQETKHAVNLWTTEFKGTNVEFKGVRHGVNMPFGEKDKHKQDVGAKQRTFEVVTAAADVKREAILKHMKDYPETPFPLTIVSSSLLTPSSGFKYKEYEMGQQKAWQSAVEQSKSDAGLTVTISGEDGKPVGVKVELKVLPFSFGVNGFAKLESSAPRAIALLNKLPGVDISGWKWADNHNKPFFNDLLTLASKNDQKEKSSRLQSYVTQINSMLDSGKHRKDEGNAYALPVLVNLLSNELGLVPAWNCMSGKDRTGYLDAKIKETLVRQHEQSRVIDQFESKPDILEKIILESGNLDVQRACTGVAGYKVNEGVMKLMGKEIDLSVQSNRNNLGSDARPLLEGLSGAVKA